MTLLNTVTNLGHKWPGTVSLWLVDVVSFKGCEGVTDLSLDCDTQQQLEVGFAYNYNTCDSFDTCNCKLLCSLFLCLYLFLFISMNAAAEQQIFTVVASI